jgi:hypothetical protein
MGCFGPGALIYFLVCTIIICAVIAIVQILLPRLVTIDPTILQILRVVLGAIVLIVIIYAVYDLFMCMAYPGIPRLRG